jgi:hypothetical protein
MSNRGFERSMNGINDIEVNEVQFPDGSTISSASNLVQLDTNNNFTSFNTFNVNLPTSTLDPVIGDIAGNTILNKNSADKLYATTDTNDYPTAFTRNGTTGEITLTTADTGIPLSGDTTITSINDAQIAQITTNANNIATNTNDIATNTNDIATNTNNIATNTNDIATNTANITTNTNNIASNTANITTNTSNIATNTANITTNTNDIATLDGEAVKLSGNQSIAGVKTFSSFPVKTEPNLTPSTDGEFATKKYVDDNTGGTPSNMVTTDTAQFISGGKIFDASNTIFKYAITQDGGSNLNYFLQSGTNCFIQQTQTSNKILTQGALALGLTNPTYKIDMRYSLNNTGKAFNLQQRAAFDPMIINDNNNLYLRASSTNNNTSFKLQNGGHHLDSWNINKHTDTITVSSGRRMYLNYYANQGIYLNRSYYSSDDRVKEEEQFITNATETLLKLRPQTYIKYAAEISGNTIKPNFDMSGNFEAGLIAQEVYYDAPELRHIITATDMSGTEIIPSSDDPQKDPDYSDWGNMTAGVNYTELIPYLIKSNQELHERIKKLEDNI